MTDLKNTILNKIQSGEVKQTSRWYFITKDYVFFFLTGLTALFGMFAVAAILHGVITEHMRPLQGVPMSMDLLRTVGQSLPYLWVGLFVLLSVVAWYNYKHTRRAYKHHNVLIVSLVLLASVAGGAILFATGEGEKMDKRIAQRMPWYGEVKSKNQIRRDGLLQRLPPKIHVERKKKLNASLPQGTYYVGLHPGCRTIKYQCQNNEEFYHDVVGCGCTGVLDTR